MVNLKELYKAIEINFQVTEKEIKSKSRSYNIVRVRYLLAYYLVTVLKINIYDVADELNRDRTTILHALKHFKPNELAIKVLSYVKIDYTLKSKEYELIRFMIERHKIKGELKEYLLNYKK